MMKKIIISVNNKLPFENLSNLIVTNLSGFDVIPTIFDIKNKSCLASLLYKNSLNNNHVMMILIIDHLFIFLVLKSRTYENKNGLSELLRCKLEDLSSVLSNQVGISSASCSLRSVGAKTVGSLELTGWPG